VKPRKPEIGDMILHREPAFRRETKGIVVELLGAQFVYETLSGHQRHCNYKELWVKV